VKSIRPIYSTRVTGYTATKSWQELTYTASKDTYGWVRSGSFQSYSENTADCITSDKQENHAYSEKQPHYEASGTAYEVRTPDAATGRSRAMTFQPTPRDGPPTLSRLRSRYEATAGFRGRPALT